MECVVYPSNNRIHLMYWNLLSNQKVSFLILKEFMQLKNVGMVHIFQNIDLSEKLFALVILQILFIDNFDCSHRQWLLVEAFSDLTVGTYSIKIFEYKLLDYRSKVAKTIKLDFCTKTQRISFCLPLESLIQQTNCAKTLYLFQYSWKSCRIPWCFRCFPSRSFRG